MTEGPDGEKRFNIGIGESLPRSEKMKRKYPRRAPLVYLPGRNTEMFGEFAFREERLGHNSPRNSRIRFRVPNWSRVILPFTMSEAHPFVRPTARAIRSSVIRERAHLWTYSWMSLMSFWCVIISVW